MAAFRKVASFVTVGIVKFHSDEERQVRYARRVATAERRVSAAELDSARAAVKRSQAETALARFETDRLRADMEALHARYVELERGNRPAADLSQRRAGRPHDQERRPGWRPEMSDGSVIAVAEETPSAP